MKENISKINQLKGACCLLVWVLHTYSLMRLDQEFVNRLLGDTGRLGVLIFFFLSGYLCTFNETVINPPAELGRLLDA